MRQPKNNDYSRLKDKFKGEIVFCVASGPSLTQEDVDSIRGKARVITVNTSFLRAPWADIHYSNDHDWWQEYEQQIRTTCSGERWTGHPMVGEQLGLYTIPYDKRGRGLQEDPTKINWGGNSGYAALQLAYKTNPRLIGLLGYDMKGQLGSSSHWHGDHPEKVRKDFNFAMWIPHFEEVAKDFESKGIEVINFTRDSDLTCFKKLTLEEFKW